MSASIYTTSFSYMGKVENDGTVFGSMTDYLGIVDKDHRVYDASKNYMGYADRDGSIYDSGHGYMGKIENEWLYDISNQVVGRVDGSPRRMAAAAYFLLLR